MMIGRCARLVLLVGALATVSTAGAAVRTQATPTPAPLAVPGTVVGTAGVNVRACPRVDCEVRGVVKLGEALTVTGEPVDGFVPVDRGGTIGYAYALYVATPGATPELRQGAPGCKRVALIFNLGVPYEPRVGILDALKADGVPATVFAMGWWAAEHPDLLKRIAAAGFVVGSHGDQRQDLTTRADADVLKDLRDAAAAIERVVGGPPEPYFTPYAAAIDERVRGLVARAGYLPVGWTVSADDWDFGVTADRVFENVMPNIHDGAIVELHLDAPTSAESTAVALPWIVERLRAQGYRFVTIPELTEPCT